MPERFTACAAKVFKAMVIIDYRMTEEWRSVASVAEGFPNYKVSNMGRVMNSKTGRILAQQEYAGLYSLYLSHERKKKQHFFVHR